MAINLIDMAKGYFTDAVVSRTSGSLGENPDTIQKALSGALPVFMGGLIARGSGTDGPNALTGLMQQFMPGAAGSPAATIDNDDDPDTLMSKGSGILDSVFGSNSGLVNGALAQFSGVKSASAAGLMGLVGSVVTGLVGRQLMSGGGSIDAGSLMSLLTSQKDSVSAAMPSGLSALMGNTPGLGALSGMMGGVTGAAGSALTGGVTAAGSTLAGATSAASGADRGRVEPTTPAYNDDIYDRPKGFNFWPWVLAALAAGLLFYFLRGCSNDKKTTSAALDDTTSAAVRDATATVDSAGATMGAMADSAGSSIATAADKAGDAIASAAASLGAFGAKKLPDGVELNIPANGIENKLIAFIEDESKAIDKTTWFNFDRLLYETGSAKLKPESREQLQNIAAILKAYPAVNLKIGGYTDNTGNAAANKKLSGQRADAALYELVRLGTSKDRLEAEGYGQEIPVASNETEAGRAQNRRTAVRVTKK